VIRALQHAGRQVIRPHRVVAQLDALDHSRVSPGSGASRARSCRSPARGYVRQSRLGPNLNARHRLNCYRVEASPAPPIACLAVRTRAALGGPMALMDHGRVVCGIYGDLLWFAGTTCQLPAAHSQPRIGSAPIILTAVFASAMSEFSGFVPYNDRKHSVICPHVAAVVRNFCVIVGQF
jgi:hypothetical protein